MELAERIKLMRAFRGWSQEEMAEKLNIAVSTYAKIERGQTDLPFSRLQQIAQTFRIELADFFGLNERNVFNIIGNSNTHNVYFCDAGKFQHENEKLKIIIEQRDREIELLQQQINEFRDIIGLLKRS